MPTQQELAEIGRKYLERLAKDKAQGKARAEATRKVIEAHRDEYNKYIKEYLAQ